MRNGKPGRVDLSGVFDETQMEEVLGQWKTNDQARWKIPAFESLTTSAPFGGKRSTPWGVGTVHDFMHAKVTVADDVVFLGSYNLSHAGEQNAGKANHPRNAEVEPAGEDNGALSQREDGEEAG